MRLLAQSSPTVVTEEMVDQNLIVDMAAATPASVTIGGSKKTTTTALTSAPNPSSVGQSVALVATVTGQGGTPTGSVIFSEGGATLGTIPLSNGVATFSKSDLSAGPHSITVMYSGDAGFNASTDSLAHTVNDSGKENTTTALTSTPNPSSTGQSVEFVATITGQGGTPTGSVTFSDGGATLGTIPLSNGVATFSKSDLAAGPHSITAIYGGDANFNASTDSLAHTVTEGSKTTTTTALTSAPNPSSTGRLVEFVATITGQGGTPTGSVTFIDGGAKLGIIPLTNGVATFSKSDLFAGPHSITAMYSGDAGFNASTDSHAHTVNEGVGLSLPFIARP